LYDKALTEKNPGEAETIDIEQTNRSPVGRSSPVPGLTGETIAGRCLHVPGSNRGCR
jgi:hypothetical protein